MTTVFKYLKGSYMENGNRLLSMAIGNKTKNNGFKFQQGNFRLSIKKKKISPCELRIGSGCGICPWTLLREGQTNTWWGGLVTNDPALSSWAR